VKRTGTTVALCLAVVSIAVVAAPQTAAGATRLGPDVNVKPCEGQTACFAAVGCQAGQYSPCSYVNLHSTSAAVPVAAPSNGVITRWRFRGGCCTETQTEARTMTLKTFRPGTQDGQFGYSFIVPVNTGPSFVIPPGNQVGAEPFVELPARLPIAAGERVGIVADHPIGFAVYSPTAGVTSTSVASNTFYNGEAYGNPFGNTAIAISVDVEPDADGDGFGDETQDCEPADPTKSGGCPPPPGPPVFTPPPVFKPGPCTDNCGGGGVVIISGPIAPVPSGDGSVIYIPLECPPTAVQPCGGFLVIKEPPAKKASASRRPKVLARTRFLVNPGKTKRLRVKLSKAGRKLLRREGRLKVRITIQPNEGEAVSVRRTLKWRGASRR